MRYMHVFSNNNRITEAGGQNSGTSDMGILSNVLFFYQSKHCLLTTFQNYIYFERGQSCDKVSMPVEKLYEIISMW